MVELEPLPYAETTSTDILRRHLCEGYFFSLYPAGHFDVLAKVLTVLPFVQTIFLTIGFLGSTVLVGVGLEADVFNFILIVGELK